MGSFTRRLRKIAGKPIPNDANKPVCSDAGNGSGLGCPGCKRFEVRIHPTNCETHGRVQALICCWCGLVIIEATEFFEGDAKITWPS